ncbi:hypothetical protein [Salininema proteolyticum]|uniref:Uncharacterized protein n=1 Tax=Salininema proteolyticum TaxID=1607685 RepID=A0ABV8TXJ3_9ACTN
MTETVAQGQTLTLVSEWTEYVGGPHRDLDAPPAIEVTNAADGSTVDSSTTTTHAALGVYTWAWDVAATLAPGDYIAQWTGTASGQDVAATELVTVTAATTALATVADLEARLGRPLDATEAARAEVLLADASALIRSYTRKTFTRAVGDVVTRRPLGDTIRLTQRPVTAINSVTAVTGTATLPDLALPAGSWTFDGIDTITLYPLDRGLFVSLPEWLSDPGVTVTYRINYDHGHATPPPDITAVTCGMVLRSLLSPSLVPGMVGETIGAYSYQLQQGSGAGGVAVGLTRADRALLDPWRTTAATIGVRR